MIFKSEKKISNLLQCSKPWYKAAENVPMQLPSVSFSRAGTETTGIPRGCTEGKGFYTIIITSGYMAYDKYDYDRSQSSMATLVPAPGLGEKSAS